MKLRIVHLLSEPNTEREQRSIEEVSQLTKFLVEYIPVVNEKWTSEFPVPREANDREFKLTQAHFGCYLSHKSAILKYLQDDIDALLICECDCVFTLSVGEVWGRIQRACKACVDHDLIAFTLGPKHGGITQSDLGDWMVTTSRFIETHCYLVPIGARDRVTGLFTLPWDACDYVWTVYGFDRGRHRIGIFDDKIVAVQASGTSLIDNREKTSEHYFRAVKGQN